MRTSTLNRKYGWKNSIPDHRDHQFASRITPEKLPTFSDLRPRFPTVYNQQQLGSCHDNKTEVLTSVGWKYFADITMSDKLATINPTTSTLSYENPSRIVRFPYNGEMICANRVGLNFKVTPDHKMLVRKWNESIRTLSSEYQLVEAKNIGWYCGLMNRVNWTGQVAAKTVGAAANSTYMLDEMPSEFNGTGYTHYRDVYNVSLHSWLKFVGIFLAEGTLLNETGKIQLAASKEREKQFIREVLSDLKISACELKDRFTFENKQIYNQLLGYGLKVRAPFKFVPDVFFTYGTEEIKSLLDGHWHGDGTIDNGGIKSHYTSSKRLADDLQRLIFLSGDESRISSRPARTSIMKDGRVVRGKHPEYRVSVCKKRTSAIHRKNDIFTEQYVGEVFCAEIPSFHTLITRREGCILVSGNCTANAVAGAIEHDQIKQGIKIFIPSRLFIYYNERVEENTVNSDSGASLRDGVTAVNKWGAPPETEWPYYTSKFTVKPPANVYTDALNYKALSYAAVNQDANTTKACIAAGYGYVFGFTVYESFESEQVAATGIVPMPGNDESVLGGHAVVAVGYNDGPKTVNGIPPQYYVVRNSWGPSWGVKGYFFMPYAYMLDSNLADDFWQITTVA